LRKERLLSLQAHNLQHFQKGVRSNLFESRFT
jgi:hypothetical protein